MPYYQGGPGAEIQVPVNGGARLTVWSDRTFNDVDVTLRSGSRVLQAVQGAGLVVDDVVVDPEVLEVRVSPAQANTPVIVTLTPICCR